MSSKIASRHRAASGASLGEHPQHVLEYLRRTATQELDPTDRGVLGQFLTPWPVAGFMASLFDAPNCPGARLLDAGAGVGSLTAAFVDRWCSASAQDDWRQLAAQHLHRSTARLDPACTKHHDTRWR